VRTHRLAWRLGVAAALLLCSLFALAGRSYAQDIPAAERDLLSADDFRLRVSAALLLGKARPPEARSLLERALHDSNPTVRTAAAAALGALGDPAAASALDRAALAESSPGARAQMRTASLALQRAAQGPWRDARYVVQLGSMRNPSGVRGEQAVAVLRAATLARARSIKGAVVTDGSDASVAREADQRGVPVLMLDGLLQSITQGRRDAQASVSAKVEFVVWRLPEQMLRGSLSGAATSFGSVRALSNPLAAAELQDQAIQGAVESALSGADRGLAMAAK